MPRNPRRISPTGLLPLPTQALDGPPVGAEGRLEPQLDPESQRVPTHPSFLRWKVGQDDPHPGPDKATGSSTAQATGHSRRTGGRDRICGARPDRRASAHGRQAQRGQGRQLPSHRTLTGNCRRFRPYFRDCARVLPDHLFGASDTRDDMPPFYPKALH